MSIVHRVHSIEFYSHVNVLALCIMYNNYIAEKNIFKVTCCESISYRLKSLILINIPQIKSMSFPYKCLHDNCCDDFGRPKNLIEQLIFYGIHTLANSQCLLRVCIYVSVCVCGRSQSRLKTAPICLRCSIVHFEGHDFIKTPPKRSLNLLIPLRTRR